MQSNKLFANAVLCVLALLSVVGCEDHRKLPSPNSVLPNSERLTLALIKAKNNSEKEAREVHRILKGRLNEGRKLYENARGAQTEAIAAMSAALTSPNNALSAEDLKKYLSEADKKRLAFHNWCTSSYKTEHAAESNRGNGWCSACDLVDVGLQLASLYTEWVKIQEARDQQQRQGILGNLARAEWDTWDKVRGN
jgi:HrpA-like RNA helicase